MQQQQQQQRTSTAAGEQQQQQQQQAAVCHTPLASHGWSVLSHEIVCVSHSNRHKDNTTGNKHHAHTYTHALWVRHEVHVRECSWPTKLPTIRSWVRVMHHAASDCDEIVPGTLAMIAHRRFCNMYRPALVPCGVPCFLLYNSTWYK